MLDRDRLWYTYGWLKKSGNHHLRCIKPWKSWDKLPTSTCEQDLFHQQRWYTHRHILKDGYITWKWLTSPCFWIFFTPGGKGYKFGESEALPKPPWIQVAFARSRGLQWDSLLLRRRFFKNHVLTGLVIEQFLSQPKRIWVVATQIVLYFHPYLVKIPILTIKFFQPPTAFVSRPTKRDQRCHPMKATQMDDSWVGLSVEKGGFTKTNWRIPIIQL